jgi:NhaP-type Na+/H+ or K+/H+ antiporter
LGLFDPPLCYVDVDSILFARCLLSLDITNWHWNKLEGGSGMFLMRALDTHVIVMLLVMHSYLVNTFQFMGWSGLRGAVGIALALSLNSEINHYTSGSDVDEVTRQQYRDYTSKLFGMVGGELSKIHAYEE